MTDKKSKKNKAERFGNAAPNTAFVGVFEADNFGSEWLRMALSPPDCEPFGSPKKVKHRMVWRCFGPKAWRNAWWPSCRCPARRDGDMDDTRAIMWLQGKGRTDD